MSLPRIRLETCSAENGIWHIDARQMQYLVKVRRCYNGSLIEGLLDGEVIELRLVCDGKSTTAEEVSRTRQEESLPKIHLLLGLLKSDQFGDALRFAAETGVYAVYLLSCKRSVPNFDEKKSEDKLTRWNKILMESTKQAGSARAPVIYTPVTLFDFDFSSLPEGRFAAFLSPNAKDLKTLEIPGELALAIGPEGDWAPEESDLLQQKGFIPVSLGKRILRASTAVAVACGAAALMYGKEK